MSLREDYELPQRTSLTSRMWVFLGILPLAALILWIVAPSSPVAVAVLAIALLALVFGGVAFALSSRDLRRPPGHNPEQPPSTR
jgi:asparagine N-glycosylation enzyme membrane subunit Stt3